MRARDINIAAHTVLDEAWVNGDFNNPPAVAAEFQGSAYNYPTVKYFFVQMLAYRAYNRQYRLDFKMLDLLGEPHPAEDDAAAATADGFIYTVFKEGRVNGSPVVIVTYKLTRISGITRQVEFQDALVKGTIAYDIDAGYEVYYLIRI